MQSLKISHLFHEVICFRANLFKLCSVFWGENKGKKKAKTDNTNKNNANLKLICLVFSLSEAFRAWGWGWQRPQCSRYRIRHFLYEFWRNRPHPSQCPSYSWRSSTSAQSRGSGHIPPTALRDWSARRGSSGQSGLCGGRCPPGSSWSHCRPVDQSENNKYSGNIQYKVTFCLLNMISWHGGSTFRWMLILFLSHYCSDCTGISTFILKIDLELNHEVIKMLKNCGMIKW